MLPAMTSNAKPPIVPRVVSAVLVAIAIAVAPGFLLYGYARANFVETVGVTISGTLLGFFAGFAIPISFVGFPLLLPTLWIERRWQGGRWAALLAVGLLVGCASAEAAMLLDEARFEREVTRNGVDKPHQRGRPWPWTNAELIYLPRQGTHATD